MHEAKEALIGLRIEKTSENLKKNGMDVYVADTRADALARLEKLMPKGSSVGCGGSVTLDEIGALGLFRSGNYRFFDRYAPSLSREQTEEIFRESLSADVYVMSANAITEDGVLYNVDGRSNRVAALTYGPKSVIVVAGYNKLVRNLDEAVLRVKTVAAPANAARLHCNTPCAKTGVCVSLAHGDHVDPCAGCDSPDRICASYVITARQRQAGRIKVILVREALGF